MSITTSFQRLRADLRLFLVRIPPARNSLDCLGFHVSTISAIARRGAEANQNSNAKASYLEDKWPGGKLQSNGHCRYSPDMKQDLLNPALFGNDAGEDEPPHVLASYFLDKPEFDSFFNPQTRVAFVRSRKGMGKSALLRQALFRREERAEGELLLYVKATDLVTPHPFNTETPDQAVSSWQQRICSRINLQLGAALRPSSRDDSWSLIEQSELAGFRDRNLLGSLVDRIRLKGGGFEIGRQPVTAGNPEAMLKRVAESKELRVWILIDDVDATFLDSAAERLRISSFFSACRNLANSVEGLVVRASVRTDVWTILAQHDEALDKCEQYMLDLHWTTSETGRILNRKIWSYFVRTHGENPDWANEDDVSGLVFKEPFNWGEQQLDAFRPIHIFSSGRPRWAAQLCRLAGRDAARTHLDLIYVSNLFACQPAYGSLRLRDLYSEYRYQCPDLERIIESFSSGPCRYATEDLLARIQSTLLSHQAAPTINGVPGEDEPMAIARFLFRIGFLSGRDDQELKGPLRFVQFEDRPNLLSTDVNPDDGLSWEIHPSYRQILRIHDDSGVSSRKRGVRKPVEES